MLRFKDFKQLLVHTEARVYLPTGEEQRAKGDLEEREMEELQVNVMQTDMVRPLYDATEAWEKTKKMSVSC